MTFYYNLFIFYAVLFVCFLFFISEENQSEMNV